MSDTGPIKLITQTESWSREVAGDVVTRLEQALERAKAGELTGVSIAATTKDGCTWTTYSQREAAALMIAAVARLQYRLLADEQT